MIVDPDTMGMTGGKFVALLCPSCGEAIENGWEFCPNCGAYCGYEEDDDTDSP